MACDGEHRKPSGSRWKGLLQPCSPVNASSYIHLQHALHYRRHVVIPVFGQPSAEYHALLRVGQRLVLAVEGEGLGRAEVLFGFVKDMFPYVLSAVLGTSLCLAMRWHDVEAMRKEMEIQKTRSELDNLRNQINPHFLLNTLNNIYALISFDTDKAQKAVLSLSQLLRQMLYGGRNNMTTLKEEVEFLRNYVELMQLRLNKNVKIDFSVDIPVDRDVHVAPFIFISLVENAFKHGVSNSKPSFIHIKIR